MAKVKKNPILKGLSGRIGNLVFKEYGDKTVVCQRPVHDPKREPTGGEARQRTRIKEAAAKAKSVLAKEEGNAYYQAARQRLGKQSAYHTAVYDFFGMPEVVSVQLGTEGDVLIQVKDNVGVQQVKVETSGGSGLAEPLEAEPCNQWRWPLNGAGPWQIRVSAEDGMGNTGEWEGLIGE